MPIQWKEEYCTGEQDVDDQHKKLFTFIDKLEALVEKGAHGGAESDRIIMFLDMYIMTHFAYEELRMNQYKCPVRKENEQAHLKFMEFFKTYKEEYALEGGSIPMLKKLQKAATDWLTNHICKIDVNLRPCVKNKSS